MSLMLLDRNWKDQYELNVLYVCINMYVSVFICVSIYTYV